jgi:virginiamycin B lyase
LDAGGDVWYAGNGDAHIGRLDPRTGAVRRYAMPDSAARDPHTLVAAPNGDLWFTVQGGNFVGHLARETGRVRLVAVPTPRARPYGIVLDARGRPWVNEFGTNKIASIDPATYQLREYALPSERARGRRIGITGDGMVWYVDYARGYLGRLDPSTGVVKEWGAPAGEASLPYAMAVDDRGRLWFVETGVQPNRLVGFDPRSTEFFSVTPIEPSGGGTVRHMVFHAPTRTLWFGTDANTIARARVP